MAKEKFVRNKPHVNVGSNTSTINDDLGTLAVSDAALTGDGNPAPSSELSFSYATSSTTGSATVAFPIDDDFSYDPATSGDVLSIDFELDVSARTVSGTPGVEISFAIVQGEDFVLTRTTFPPVDGSDSAWNTYSFSGLTAGDFEAADGGSELPDFGRPFQFGYAFTAEKTESEMAVVLGLDNMTVELTTVPEPTSVLLAAALGTSLVCSRWWPWRD